MDSLIPRRALNIRELLVLEHEDFIRSAYLTILERPADQDGLVYYATRLLEGHSKFDLLRELLNSDEARFRAVDIQWLSSAIGEHVAAKREATGEQRTVDQRIMEGRRKLAASYSRLFVRMRSLQTRLDELENEFGVQHSKPSALLPTGKDHNSISESSSMDGDERLKLPLVTKRILRELTNAIRLEDENSRVREWP